MYRLFAIVFIFQLASGHYWGHGGPGWDSGSPERGQGGHDWGHGGHDWGHGGHDCDQGHGGSHQHPWHGRLHRHHQESEFDRLARCVISADKQVQNVCQQSPVSRTKLLQAQDFYTVKYSLPEFSEQDITVKYKHRVLYVTAGPPNAETFKDLRIIPDFVKIADASWYYDNGVATVLIPYKNNLYTEVVWTCGEVNESVVVVPKAIPEGDLRSLGAV